VTDLLVADQWNAFECCSSVFMKWFNCAKKLPGLVLCNLQFLTSPKNNTLKKKSRVGLCDPPFGSLCLTFREMAKSPHEQSARVMILNSNRLEPLADGGLDRQKVTTRESTQRTSNGDQNIKKLRGPLMADLKRGTSAKHNCAKGSIRSKSIPNNKVRKVSVVNHFF
jgi:hypothetical protein